jgi:hydroxymethylbilane synthase
MTISNLPANAVVATGSLRRKCLLLHLRPDITVKELRGNVPTRIEKFEQSDWDAIILARAGIERLKLNKYISSIIPMEEILPAVGQGALGIEIAAKNKFAEKVVKSINHENTYCSAIAERAFLKSLEGGCQAPIGAYAEVGSNGLYLEGVVGSIDGTITFRKKIKGKKSEAEILGKQLASELKKAGAERILKEIYSNHRK